jgi:hypothetical protein
VGETAGFKPDELFLSVLAPAIQTERGQVGKGLVNKRYYGALFTTPRFSPLKWLANKMRVADANVAGATTTFKVHDYSFREPIANDTRVGTELDADFALESPAGVTYSINLSGFWPGAALTSSDQARGFGPMVKGFQGAAVIRLTVKM